MAAVRLSQVLTENRKVKTANEITLNENSPSRMFWRMVKRLFGPHSCVSWPGKMCEYICVVTSCENVTHGHDGDMHSHVSGCGHTETIS